MISYGFRVAANGILKVFGLHALVTLKSLIFRHLLLFKFFDLSVQVAAPILLVATSRFKDFRILLA